VDLRQCQELGPGQSIFAGGDGGPLELVEVDDSQVDLANRVRVAVDQPDAADRPVALDRDFLVEFVA
jgi:hypothetical protein